jgi:hypothetical protein
MMVWSEQSISKCLEVMDHDLRNQIRWAVVIIAANLGDAAFHIWRRNFAVAFACLWWAAASALLLANAFVQQRTRDKIRVLTSIQRAMGYRKEDGCDDGGDRR